MQRQAKAPTVRVIKALVAVGLVVGVFFVRTSAQTGAAGPFVAGDILVKFRPGSNASAKADAHRIASGNPVAEISRTGVQRVRVAPGKESAALALYRRNPNVVYAEPNFIRTIPMGIASGAGAPVMPGDHYFDEQWALHNTGQSFYCVPWPSGGELCVYTATRDADIDAPEAWAIFKGNSRVTVAVIDSGIDYTHPDVAPNYAGGADFVFFDGDPMDDHGHGTHIAGTIAAALDNPTGSPAEAEGIAGIAPYARLLAYKVCRSDGSCDDFAIQQAVARAIDDGANIINMSFGESAFSQSLNDAVQDAWNAGLVIVAGAGNDGTTNPFYPAAFDNVISVAAFDEDHRRASFSNYGNWVDISAPGNVIMSTYPMSACSTSTEPGDIGCYTWKSGTSMASPHVAGAAALVWSRHDVTSNSQVVDILLNSADGQGVAGVRLDAWTIHGGLNLHDAVTYGLTNLPPLADAGEDQAVTDNDHDGGEMVTLDGAGSSDRDGSIVSYEWREGSTVVGSGATATVWLPTGNHTLTLEVTDEDGDSSVDDVFVSVDFPNRVSVTASTAQANESGPANGVFTISRTGETSAALTVHYSIGGTAVPGTDYVALPGEVTIGAGSAAATVVVTPIDDAVYESNETVILTLAADPAYGLDAPTSGTVSIVSDELPPDLSISSMTAPSAAGADSDIVVTDTTKNQGTGSSPASKTGFYLSSNAALDGADIWLGDRAVPSLGPGATHSISTTLHVPPTTTTGSYYVIAKADRDGTITESSETNNVRASGVVKVGPDLVISAVSAPAATAAGATIDVSHTIKNQGGGNAAGSTTRFYWSANTSFDASDQMIGSRMVAPLTAGASASYTASVTVPAAAAGTYYVIAQADGPGAIPETTENNNTRASAGIKVGPDLVVTTVSVPATGAAGGTISATDTTKNQGGGASAPSSTGFYLSTNSTISTDDDFIGSRSVGGLTADGTSTGPVQLQIPTDTLPGSYYVIARADWNGVIGESTENNNDRSSGLIRIGGDLIVASMSAPATGKANGQITITETTKNQGAALVPETTTAFYLSSNSTHEPTDQFLGSRIVGPLGASASSSESTQVVIPPGTAPGSYYVVAVADAGNVAAESLEDNNTRSSSAIRLGPDFIVSALTAPSSAVAGTSLTASDTTKNQGGDAAPASVTWFYLSSNASLDAGDVLVGSRGVPPLNSGLSQAGSASLVIPLSTTTGTYYIIATSDGDDSIAEALENNNTRNRSISITAAPAP